MSVEVRRRRYDGYKVVSDGCIGGEANALGYNLNNEADVKRRYKRNPSNDTGDRVEYTKPPLKRNGRF